ncbi:hypothetical protein FRC00_003792 [Tulasnella sp. 408]|nr:hypothetical protein FRC00_003792 [Tulasnella sp. 408]
MYTSSLAVLALSVASAQAHAIFQRVHVNGVDQGLVKGIRYPDYNGPITDVDSNDIICNGGVNPLHTPLPTDIINIPAGASVAAEWHHGLNTNPGLDPSDSSDPIDSSHKGPIMAYLAKVDSALTTTVTGLQWFKIWEDGFHSDGTWAVDTMIANKGLVNFTIPTCIPPGNYLLRVELIALHGASVYPGAQFYMECAQINVTGGGTASPATVSFPGAYHGTDPCDKLHHPWSPALHLWRKHDHHNDQDLFNDKQDFHHHNDDDDDDHIEGFFFFFFFFIQDVNDHHGHLDWHGCALCTVWSLRYTRTPEKMSSNPPQGATQVDLDNAPGKRNEAEPVVGGDIANLPNYGTPAAEVKAEGDDGGDVSMAEGEGAGGGGDDNEEADEDGAAVEANRLRLEEEARKYLAAQTHEVIIPSYASWFDMASIHPVEQRALPEFFNSKNRSKTPSVYKDYRDFMINSYRLRPTEYLTLTACRRNLAGDVCAIMRVHAFLEQWGLINYQVDPETRPAALGPPFTGHFRVTVDTPRGLQPLHPGSRAGAPPPTTNGTAQASAKPTPASLELRKSIYHTSMKASRPVNPEEAADLAGKVGPQPASSVTYSCDTCGVDCTKVRYHSLKAKDFELCPTCYLDGRFPSKMFSGDFIKLTSTDAYKHSNGVVDGEDDWTDEEKLLLLEGIEMYDDDWYAISEHVRTRSKEQCVAQFLQMPIEDYYVNPPREGDLGPLAYGRIPFDQTDNPVMSVVAFLASAVSPGVAAAAAQSALGELTDGLRKKVERPANGKKEDETASAPPDSHEEEGQAPATATHSTMDVDAIPPMASSPSAIPRNAVERAAAIALASAAAKASSLAQHETSQIRSLTNQLIKSSLKKFELKMKHFETLEDILETERRNLEVARQSVLSERAGIRKALEQVNELTNKLQQQEQQAAMNMNMGMGMGGAGLMAMGGVQGVHTALGEVMQNAGMMPPGAAGEVLPMPDGYPEGQGPFGVDDTGAIITPLT